MCGKGRNIAEAAFWKRYPTWAQFPVRDIRNQGFRLNGLEFRGSMDRHVTLGTKTREDVDFKAHVAKLEVDPANLAGYGNPQLNPKCAYDGAAKFGGKDIKLSEENLSALDLAFQWTTKHFAPYCSDAGMISMTDAINDLDLTTSPGFPWSMKYGSKKDFLHSADSGYLKIFWDNLGSDKGPNTVWSNSLKDELRPIEKVRSGNTRVVHGAPVEHVVATNMFCLEQNRQFYSSHLMSASAVGLNPYAGGWDRLYRKLKRFNRGFALDEKSFDTTMIALLLSKVRDMRWKWLERTTPPQNRAELKAKFWALYDDIINTVIVTPLGEFIQKFRGNPSGSSNTVVDNTLVLYAMLAFCWIKTVSRSYAEFESKTAKALYGDDNTFTVCESVIDKFCGTNIRKWAAEIGINVKDVNLQPRPVLELDFLKKNFVLAGRIAVFAPLDSWKYVSSLLLRTKKNATPALRLGRACAIRQLVFFSTAFPIVDSWCKKLIETHDGECTEQVEWDLAKAQYQTEHEIVKSYVGYESFSFPTISKVDVDTCLKMSEEKKKDAPLPGKNVVRNRRRRAARNARRKQNGSYFATGGTSYQGSVPVIYEALGAQTPISADVFAGLNLGSSGAWRITGLRCTLVAPDPKGIGLVTMQAANRHVTGPLVQSPTLTIQTPSPWSVLGAPAMGIGIKFHGVQVDPGCMLTLTASVEMRVKPPDF